MELNCNGFKREALLEVLKPFVTLMNFGIENTNWIVLRPLSDHLRGKKEMFISNSFNISVDELKGTFQVPLLTSCL